MIFALRLKDEKENHLHYANISLDIRDYLNVLDFFPNAVFLYVIFVQIN